MRSINATQVREFVDEKLGPFREYAEAYWDLIEVEFTEQGNEALAHISMSSMYGALMPFLEGLHVSSDEQLELLRWLKARAWAVNAAGEWGGKRPLTFESAWKVVEIRAQAITWRRWDSLKGPL
jgi:hypothetical protein